MFFSYEIKKRMFDLKLFRKDNKLSQKELADLLNCSQSYISALESGRKPVLDAQISILEKKFGGIKKYITKKLIPDGNNNGIRYWADVDATGGNIAQFDDSLSARRIDIQIPEFSDCTDAINIYGDSMYPRFKSGQIIILKEWEECFISFGNAYLIITRNGNRMVKYINPGKSENTVCCSSENPGYAPFEVPKEDILKLYLVKGSIEKCAL